MNSTHFDELTRKVGPVDRKTSLKIMGGSLAAIAAARPLASEAKKNNKKCKNRVRRKCQRQVQPCKDFWSTYCGSSQSCKDFYHGCCDNLSRCRGSKYFDCTFIASAEVTAAP